MIWQTARTLDSGLVSTAPLRIYTGILGQIGDIVMFTPTSRRLKELFPNSTLTFAVSRRYREAGELVVGLPYVDRLFVTELYCERLEGAVYDPWHLGWPVDLRGEDEIVEERRHDLVFPTRPRHRRASWWEHSHQTEETAHALGVPGPIDRQTEIRIPDGAALPEGAAQKIVLHNDPAIDATKGWSWEEVHRLVRALPEESVVLLGNPGPEVAGVLDLRGRTTLIEAARVIQHCRAYVGIDSGLMWIAASLQVPVVGLYGTSYIPRPDAIQPENPRARYLQVEGPASGFRAEAVLAALEPVLSGASGGSDRAASAAMTTVAGGSSR